ncbi:SusC/RagA family TonB-linked outer membrane protein [Aridibaculum aurantiacum]|uniref:SusC/RagA family TonB-linked outer membrane protein n=1 Tax=Aridibaculum aurantiacum TaxID=2810307 RepID=UPI001A959F51|nr:TonB-dependent receptor [Aridibaculum aurantiacum]
MLKRIFLAILLVQLSVLFASAQTLRITGQIVDDSTKAPISNVSVVVTETKKGVSTDAEGRFTLTVTGRSSATLLISSVGYRPVTITTDGRTPVNVSLMKEQTQLDEVVVVGYQTVRRRDLTGSVSSVSSRQLRDIPVNSAADALAGRLAGVQITSSEGSPNAEAVIRVRGGGSITQNASPIYIIDGVQVEDGLNVISPQDIESVDVLKDASTTAIYGARGANGVVIITTKGGRNTRTSINYNGFTGVRKLARKLPVMNPYDFVMYQYERTRGSSSDSSNFARTYGTTWDTLQNYKNVPMVDWQDEMFGRNAIMQTHNLSLSGGNAATTYNLSLTYNKEQGTMLLSDFERKLVSFKFDHTFNKNIKVGFNTRYNNTLVNGAGTSNEGSSATNRLRHSIRYRPFLVRERDLTDYDPDYDDETNAAGLRLINPLLMNAAEYRRNVTNVMNMTGYVQYTYNKYLSLRSTIGIDMNNQRRNAFDDTLTSASRQRSAAMPLASIRTIGRNTLNLSNVLTFNFDKSKTRFSENNSLSIIAGQEIYEQRFNNMFIETLYFPVGITPNRALANMNLGTGPQGQPQPRPTTFEVESRIASFFSRVNYSYKDRYLLNVSVRADGSTKFAPGNRWGYFPSGTFAWRVSKEKFMENVNWISDLKFRAGYGEAGNNRIDDFLYLTSFGTNTQYNLNNALTTGYLSQALSNNNLVWEENVSRNVGVDASFLRNKLTVSVDLYKNNSNNLLVEVAVPQNSGYQRQIQNVGALSNKGVEIQLNAIPVSTKNFNYNINFNASFNKNNIESLGAFQKSFLQSSGWAGGNQPADYIVKVGSPVGAIWGLVTEGFYRVEDFDFNPTTNAYTLKPTVASNQSVTSIVPQPGTIRFRDINGDGIVNDLDRTIIGDATPKVFGGLNQQLSYKNWDLSLFINYQFGNDVLNASKLEFTSGYTPNSNLLADMNNRWRTVNAQGEVVRDPQALAALNANATIWRPITSASAFNVHSWAVEDASFVRINNLTIGYNLPVEFAKRARMQRARLYVTLNNLAVITSYSGFDPEVSTRRNFGTTPGVDYSAYPRSRSYIFGVNVTF